MSDALNNPYGSPVSPSAQGLQSGTTRFRLKRIDPISVAKISGIFYALLGFILVVPIMLLAFIGMLAEGEAAAIAGGVIGALMISLVGPVFYGVMGFIGGLIAAWLYNVCAGFVGGVEIELER